MVHKIGESQSEMLDWVPATLKVIRITRPKYACRACGKVTQAAVPEPVIAGGLATPALLAQVLFASRYLFADDTPVPVLDPRRGKTTTGRLCVYARDDRPRGDPAPPPAVFMFEPDRGPHVHSRISGASKAWFMLMAMSGSSG